MRQILYMPFGRNNTSPKKNLIRCELDNPMRSFADKWIIRVFFGPGTDWASQCLLSYLSVNFTDTDFTISDDPLKCLMKKRRITDEGIQSSIYHTCSNSPQISDIQEKIVPKLMTQEQCTQLYDCLAGPMGCNLKMRPMNPMAWPGTVTKR